MAPFKRGSFSNPALPLFICCNLFCAASNAFSRRSLAVTANVPVTSALPLSFSWCGSAAVSNLRIVSGAIEIKDTLKYCIERYKLESSERFYRQADSQILQMVSILVAVDDSQALVALLETAEDRN